MVDPDLHRVIEYILNRATEKELEVIKSALDKRTEDSHYMISGGNIREMAQKTNQALGERFDSMGQIKSMTDGFLRELVHQAIPDIPEEHLELLLGEWIPDQTEGPTEEQLPRDAVETMVTQFVAYSTGQLPPAQVQELRSQDDWSRRYWAVFSTQTRQLIRDLLYDVIDEDEFWQRFRQ